VELGGAEKGLDGPPAKGSGTGPGAFKLPAPLENLCMLLSDPTLGRYALQSCQLRERGKEEG
jgi:hypothetical protein